MCLPRPCIRHHGHGQGRTSHYHHTKVTNRLAMPPVKALVTFVLSNRCASQALQEMSVGDRGAEELAFAPSLGA